MHRVEPIQHTLGGKVKPGSNASAAVAAFNASAFSVIAGKVDQNIHALPSPWH